MLDSYKDHAVPIPRDAETDDSPSLLRDIKQVVEYVEEKDVGKPVTVIGGVPNTFSCIVRNVAGSTST